MGSFNIPQIHLIELVKEPLKNPPAWLPRNKVEVFRPIHGMLWTQALDLGGASLLLPDLPNACQGLRPVPSPPLGGLPVLAGRHQIYTDGQSHSSKRKHDDIGVQTSHDRKPTIKGKSQISAKGEWQKVVSCFKHDTGTNHIRTNTQAHAKTPSNTHTLSLSLSLPLSVRTQKQARNANRQPHQRRGQPQTRKQATQEASKQASQPASNQAEREHIRQDIPIPFGMLKR